jgi:hypothetical protein
LAAEWIEKPKEWIAQCDNDCTVAAVKKQTKVFKDFEAQLECRSRGNAPQKAPVAASSPASSSIAPAAQTAKPKDATNRPNSKPAM